MPRTNDRKRKHSAIELASPKPNPDAPPSTSATLPTTLEAINSLPNSTFSALYLPPSSPLLTYTSPSAPSTSTSPSSAPPAPQRTFHLTLHASPALPPSLLDTCLALIRTTSRADYAASALGWRPRAKRAELARAGMRLLVARDPAGGFAGFLSFTLTPSDAAPAAPARFDVYVYELHLCVGARGAGLARHMLLRVVAGEVARRCGAEKVMLTVFVRNGAAMGFYKGGCGFVRDVISPVAGEGGSAIGRGRRLRSGRAVGGKAEKEDGEGEAGGADYEILSRPVE